MTLATGLARAGYRQEIDGLRCVAVMPVILFHAGFSLWSGGYVGVDVFFVISGYLITGILLGDLERKRFSMLGFYERRARRILPALFVVCLASLALAWVWMLPIALEGFARSLVSVATFSANFYFWAQEDYFAPSAELLPLLHIWSLAVEEQFYLIFPPLLLLGWRLGRRGLFRALVAGLVMSFALTLWAAPRFPAMTFYLPFTRFWELLAGALCALVVARRVPAPSSALSLLGLGLIAGPVFLFEATTPAPMLALPVLGAALVLVFGAGETVTARLLRLAPLSGIGLISYSAYLWHQPLFAFARIRLPDEPSAGMMLGLTLVTLGLAAVTWRFVEQPMRRGPSARFQAQRPVLVFSGAGLAVMLAAGLGLMAAGGAPGRVPEEVRRIDAARARGNPLGAACHMNIDSGTIGRTHPLAGCATGPVAGGPPVILTGDSHANALSWQLRQAMAAEGRPLYAVSMSSCPPIAGLRRIGGPNLMACDGFVRGMRDHARATGSEVIVLSARWRFSLDGTKFDNGEGGVEGGSQDRAWELADGGDAGLEGAALRGAMLERYVADIEGLLAEGFKVVLVYPIPETGWNVPDRLARQRMAWADAPDLSTDPAAFEARNGAVIAAFDAIEDPNLYRVRPERILCETLIPGRCANSFGEAVLYHDESHVTGAGAKLIVPAVMEILDAIAPMAPGN